MVESDEEKTAFHTNQGVYCYTKIPFDLKNVDATYQRLVDKAFDNQVGRNIEVYVDDLVIKSHTKTEILRDIDETFLKKSLLLFKTLKKCIKKSEFHWTPEAEHAFKQLKQHLSELPMLVAPKPKEELIGPKLNYTPMEKLVLTLVFTAKRPRTSVKGHILADFLVEKPNEAPPDTSVVETSPEGTKFTYALRFQFTASNNEEEYEALIAGLRIAAQMGVCNVHVLKEKSIQEKEVATVVDEEGPTWMTPIIEYLKDRTLPEDRKEASKLRIKARQYELLEGVLYRRSFLKPWLRNPQQPLTPITAPWPFYKWGIDIAGPFPERPRKVKFLIVAMDYFTKWIEAKAVATITGSQVKKFMWDNIVCRFGLLGEIVSDNCKQFSDNPFKDWSLGEGIKARLGEGNKNWIEELPHVFWAHRTMIKSSHGDTPFFLTYGTEAVIPAKIRMPTYCTAIVDAVHNNEELRLNLDLLEERRERVAIRKANAKLKMTKHYNARVRGVTFRPRDFVYHSNDASHAVDRGKLGPK
ncbi:reverse transcriptase domain-containing protein [Tanacetum coccineum]|uniref:Reverse transcriptase domain-containing protein n=1 Tax=Tanacetum coccineum TaxID=301880 RepID=A0ABQ5I4D9_9ASTR